jgi:hypothetical protein
MKSKKWILLLVILGFFVVSGCREPKVKGLVPARGTVTYKDEPLEGAAVCFTPKEFNTGDRLATGKTDVNGRFELRTIGELGVLPGEYRVSVVKNVAVETPSNPGQAEQRQQGGRPVRPQKVKLVIPARYNDEKKSGLEFLIGEKGNKGLEIKIEE